LNRYAVQSTVRATVHALLTFRGQLLVFKGKARVQMVQLQNFHSNVKISVYKLLLFIQSKMSNNKPLLLSSRSSLESGTKMEQNHVSIVVSEENCG